MQTSQIGNTLTVDETKANSLTVLSYPESQDYLFQVLDFLPCHDLLTIQSTTSHFNTVASHLLLRQKFNINQLGHYFTHYSGKYLLQFDWQTETRTINDLIAARIYKRIGNPTTQQTTIFAAQANAFATLVNAVATYPEFFQGLAVIEASQLSHWVNQVHSQAAKLQKNNIAYHIITNTFTYPCVTNAKQILHYLYTTNQLESLLIKLAIHIEEKQLRINPLYFDFMPYQLATYQPKSGLSLKEIIEMDVFFGCSPRRTINSLLTQWTKIHAKAETAKSIDEKQTIINIENFFQAVTRKDILDAQACGLFNNRNNNTFYFNSPLLRLVEHLREEEVLAFVKAIPDVDNLFNESSYFKQKASLALKLQTILSQKYPSHPLLNTFFIELVKAKLTEREYQSLALLLLPHWSEFFTVAKFDYVNRYVPALAKQLIIERFIQQFTDRKYWVNFYLYTHFINAEDMLHDALDRMLDRGIYPPAKPFNTAKRFNNLANEQRLANTLQKFLAADMDNEQVILSIEGLAEANESFKSLLINSHAMLTKLFAYYEKQIQIQNIPMSRLILQGLTASSASRVTGAIVSAILGSLLWLITYPILVLGIALLIPFASCLFIYENIKSGYKDKFMLSLALLSLPLSLLVALSAPILAFTHLPFLIKNNAQWGYKMGLLSALKNTFKLPWLISQGEFNCQGKLFSIENSLLGLLIHITCPVKLFLPKPIKGQQINNALNYYHQLKTKLEEISLSEQPTLQAIAPKIDNTLAKSNIRGNVSQLPLVLQTINRFGFFNSKNRNRIAQNNNVVSNNNYSISP